MIPKLYGERITKVLNFLAELGSKPRVGKQLLRAVYRNNITRFDNLHELSGDIRCKLTEKFGPSISALDCHTIQSGDQAIKALYTCIQDEAKIESVSLSFNNHKSLCISSQVGCAFGCAFCATGKIGLKRQLTVSEISDQLFHLKKPGESLSVSFMGMGEPLANPKVFDAISAITNPDQFNVSNSRVNISTIGIIPGLVKLTERHPNINVTFSLHSPFPEQRIKLMPIEKVYPSRNVFDYLDDRIRKTNNRVWIAYLLLEGINDSVDHARALVDILKSRPAEVRYLYHVNLLPYNTARNVPGDLRRVADIAAFKQILDKAGISNSYRNSFGRGIDAACGQLYADYEARTVQIDTC
jgi:adenine C2-methylase RlmN of 23S rRNA A2503 and tRNA A37